MRKQILKRVLGFSRPYIGYLVLALISAVLSVGMTLYAPILIGRGIDQIIGPGNVDFKAILIRCPTAFCRALPSCLPVL